MKILKVPMRNYSTLIYLVNSYQSEPESNPVNLDDEFIDSFLTTIPEAENLPSNRAIDNILNFARSYETYKTAGAGYVELNLN